MRLPRSKGIGRPGDWPGPTFQPRMRFVALATDFDGTLARHGVVSNRTVAALERLRGSGRRLLLVSGRELLDLQQVFPRLDLFDACVLENGATLYSPKDQEEQLLADPPPETFLTACREAGVSPLSAGRVIVATDESETPTVLDIIHALGLELQPIFNRGSLMILPSGVNKASGLATALRDLGLSPHNVVAVGDAENDHAFLNFCECGVAVGNALPSLKQRADLVMQGGDGDGVVELIDALIDHDLAQTTTWLRRHEIRLGRSAHGESIGFPVSGRNLLIAGSSGAGKSSITSAFVEQLVDARYQVCVIDPEGDYKTLGDAVVLGEPKSPPAVEAALAVLVKPERSVVLNLLGVRLEDRPIFFQALITRLQELALRRGRPHWVVVDEAHHMLPADGKTPFAPVKGMLNTALVTVRPEHVLRDAVRITDALIAVGKEPAAAARAWSAAVGVSAASPNAPLERGHALLWFKEQPALPLDFQLAESRNDRVRHSRKYASGELPPDRSFYFRGPEKKLKLRADNITTFLRMADGVDEETWLHHLRQGDYSRWMRTEIRSEELADEMENIERAHLSPEESRARIREAIEKRFTISE